MYLHDQKDVFSFKIMILFCALIWNATKPNNDITFCKDAQTIIIVDIWLTKLFKPILLVLQIQVSKLLL